MYRIGRWSGAAAIAAGAFGVLSAMVLMVDAVVPALPGLVYLTLFLYANIATAFALIGLYWCQAEESGEVGLIGFIVSITGLLLAVANFFPPLGWLIYAIGVATLAAASQRARVLPRWGGGLMWGWAAGSLCTTVATIIGLSPLVFMGLVLLGCIKIGLGVALLTVGRRSVRSLVGA